jgi:predicted TIM-barrel fold metal-dependent hydrolase
MGNSRTIAELICGGIPHRFPDLKFVSVESGISWIPFVLATLDWQWLNSGVPKEHPEYELMPSEYFQRQFYGCFWFEHGPVFEAAVDAIGYEHVLYETDFPHPTSMTPGPASVGMKARDWIDQNLADMNPAVRAAILHDNAAKLYHVN